MQSDRQYKAMKGRAPFEAEGAMEDMRAFSLQVKCSPFWPVVTRTLLTFDDLKGKRVNIGNPGSGQRDTLEEIMEKKAGIVKSFALASSSNLLSKPVHSMTTTLMR